MITNRHRNAGMLWQHSRGTTLIEVLVTILIIAIGLLGMAGMQARSHTFEFESYQRAQALILLQDMVDRMNGNAANVTEYKDKTAGTGVSDAADCAGLGSRALSDVCEWSKALKGGSELSGTQKSGAMMDGYGCVTQIGTSSSYLVSVVWQGMSDTVPAVSPCGQALAIFSAYPNRRRAVTGIVTIPDLGAP